MANIPAGLYFPPVVILFAYFLDLFIGDPEGWPHPVRWVGRLIASLERALRPRARSPRALRLAGAALAVITVAVVYVSAAVALELARRYSTPVFYLLCTYIVWTSLAITSLETEALRVTRALEEMGLAQARAALARIVGRDTAELSEGDVLKATVETVSENTSDGIVAPLFYLAIGGPALMIAFKAVNTLDSMVGYKNERYIDFGRFSARLDDAANYVPARLTAALMVFAAFILRYNWRRSLRVIAADSRAHASPNAGWPEAAVAGALGIRLGGGARYNGVWSPKPVIGDSPERAGYPAATEPGAVSVESSIRIMRVGALLMVALAVLARAVPIYLYG